MLQTATKATDTMVCSISDHSRKSRREEDEELGRHVRKTKNTGHYYYSGSRICVYRGIHACKGIIIVYENRAIHLQKYG
jgi:hypothetical protein